VALAQAAGGREPLGQDVPAAKLVLLPGARQSGYISCGLPPAVGVPAPWLAGGQAARRRTSQTVAAMSSTESASSQPPSIHWKGQNRLPG
jgi:hypothetical protein